MRTKTELEERIVIIDDDPTGCQTVREIPLLLVWDLASLQEALSSYKIFFILTNTRAMTPEDAAQVSDEVCSNLKTANGDRYRLLIMSRGDSTLRGYTHIETQAIINTLGPYDAMIVCPAFFEASRYTIGGTHYLRSDKGLLPVAQSEFARDAVFSYTSSYLPRWLNHVTQGFFSDKNSIIIDKPTIDRGEEAVFSMLTAIDKLSAVIIDALNYSDLTVVDAAIKRAEKQGKRYFYRTAASMVMTRIEQKPAPFYQATKRGCLGLIVAGSYTKLTTSQIHHLLETHKEIKAKEIPIQWAISNEHSAEFISFLDKELKHHSCLLYTSRKYAFSDSDQDKQALSKRVSDYTDSIVRGISTKPDFIIAKGGITSYSIAKNALGAQRATVKGQIAAAIPVWKIEDEDLDYVVFPGNVGEKSSLTQIIDAFI